MKVGYQKSYLMPPKGCTAKFLTFRENHENIFKDFADGFTAREVCVKYGVSYQIGCLWKRHWLAAMDFVDEPLKIIEMKAEIAKRIGSRTTSGIIDSGKKRQAFSIKVADINAMRLKGLNIIDMGMDRIMELIATEKTVNGIASVIKALLPYVAVPMSDMSSKGTPLDVKKATFIQNVMNVYNNPQKAIPNETIEDIEPEWDPEG